MKRTNEAILAEVKKTGIITERDLLLIKNRANHGRGDILSEVSDEAPRVTDEQCAKGLAWLKNLHRTPLGKVRKWSPFGSREIAVLEGANPYFTLSEWIDGGRYGVHFYLPVYTLNSDGGAFDYYLRGGEIEIIG